MTQQTVLWEGSFAHDLRPRWVTADGRTIELSARELTMLEVFPTVRPRDAGPAGGAGPPQRDPGPRWGIAGTSAAAGRHS